MTYAKSNSWEEDTVTWSTAPGVNHVLATIGRTHPDSWVEVDVTGMLLTEDGVVTLRVIGEPNNHSWPARYSSKESREAPELRVFFG